MRTILWIADLDVAPDQEEEQLLVVPRSPQPQGGQPARRLDDHDGRFVGGNSRFGCDGHVGGRQLVSDKSAAEPAHRSPKLRAAPLWGRPSERGQVLDADGDVGHGRFCTNPNNRSNLTSTSRILADETLPNCCPRCAFRKGCVNPSSTYDVRCRFASPAGSNTSCA
jgi:hypothetical protein